MYRRGILALASTLFFSLPAWAVPTHLVILHTNDTHNHLLPFDTKRAKDLGGIARRATLIEQIRAKEKALVFDAGDVFQGTPTYTFFKGEADYRILDAIGYDATTIGNHEFDDGYGNVAKQWQGKRFPIINSNLCQNDKPLFTESKVFAVNGVKVGVFGLLGTDAVGTISAKFMKGIQFRSPAETARRMVAKLKKEADVVVLLSHSGYQEDQQLAKEVPGIDVIVGGHSHTYLPEPTFVKNALGTTAIVQTGQWGENLGRLDLEVENQKVLSVKGKLLPVDASIAPDPKIAQLVDGYESQIKAKMSEVIGQTPTALQSSRSGPSELGNWISDLTRTLTGADLAILNTGGIRAPLPAGDITVGHIFSSFPFDNQLVTIDVPGTLLQEILDENAA
ncbi:MAG: bifunctional metallophosphatase/5'-nucleotidase, partial [Bacteroidota bacterium]